MDQLNHLVMKVVEAALTAKGATFMNSSSTEGDGERGVPHESFQEPSRVARERYLEKMMEEDHEAQQERILT